MSAVRGTAAASLRLASPLGEEAVPLALSGREALSEPFHFRLTLALGGAADPKALLGEPLGVTLVGDSEAEGDRRLHGIATAVETGPEGVVVELRPWLALLELRADRRIFQTRTPAEIVEAVAADAGFRDLELRLQGRYDPLDYRVQAGESDFAFVTRLLAEFGIGYFFVHAEDAHTLVLVDDRAGFGPATNAAELPFRPEGSAAAALTNVRVTALHRAERLATDRVTLGDFAFATPSTVLRATAGDGTREVYAHPGGFATGAIGDAAARRRLEAYAARTASRIGRSPCRQLAAGTTTTLAEHPDAGLNGEVVIRAVTHDAQRNSYEATFEAFAAEVPFRPPLPPRAPARGLETAKVVGPAGEELFCDEHGRIKVKFAWDRAPAEDETSSCWLRVAQSWAGSGWGAFALPRIGQEVLVAFLDGDPDRPLVVGTVYNGDNATPYGLPEAATRTVLKTHSTPGGEGFNELSFEDAAGEEEVYLKAQKDWRVEVGGDVTETITENRSTTIENGDESLTIGTGARTVSVKGAQTHDTGGAHTQSVKGPYTLDVVGDVTIKSRGSITLEGMGGITLKTSAGDITLDSAMGLTGKAGMALALSGGTTMEVKGNAMGTIDGGGMLTVKGGLVKIN
ncbi:MAG: type VI secretion system Vgr family protein [Alphaproteobacteria bacterium]